MAKADNGLNGLTRPFRRVWEIGRAVPFILFALALIMVAVFKYVPWTARAADLANASSVDSLRDVVTGDSKAIVEMKGQLAAIQYFQVCGVLADDTTMSEQEKLRWKVALKQKWVTPDSLAKYLMER